MQYHGENDALALEYKLEYGCATRNLDIPDVVDDPLGQRVSGVLGLSFQKKLLDLVRTSEPSPLLNNAGNLSLVRVDTL